jgi:hypothetical protein
MAVSVAVCSVGSVGRFHNGRAGHKRDARADADPRFAAVPGAAAETLRRRAPTVYVRGR